MSSATIIGRLAVAGAMFGAVAVLGAPLWADAVIGAFAGSRAYTDTYYLVIDYGVIGSWLAALFLVGIALMLWGRRRD